MANIINSYQFYYIYLIKNLINRKCYVGFHATNIEYDDYFGSSETLNNAIKKYGIENFVMGIIEHINPYEWQEKEKFWIKEKNAHASLGGYNLTWGGDGTLGLLWNKASKQKLSNTSKHRTEIHLSRIKKTILSKRSEINKSISKSLTGRKLSGAQLLNAQTAFLGKVHTQETKDLISKKHTGKQLSQTTKNKIRDANLNKIMSENVKEQIGLSNKGKIRSQEAKKHYRDCKLGVKRSTQICPHCKKEIANGNYQRWHGNNCKNYIFSNEVSG